MAKINLKIIFALAFWLFVLHVRLFRNYRDILFSTKTLNEHKYLFASLFFITLALTIITLISLFLSYKKIETNKKNKIVSFLEEEFHWVFSLITKLDEGKKDLYSKIFDKLPDFHFLVRFTYIFLTHFKKLRLVLFAGIVLPRIIIISCLISEIYFGRLHYYYYSLILLLIPLGVQLIIYMLNDIGSRLSYVIREYIVLDTVPPDSGEFVKHKESIKMLNDLPVPAKTSKVTLYYISFKKEYQYCDLDSFLEYFFYPITSISAFMDLNFSPLYQKVRLFTLFSYFFVQTCCWGYIFFFLL